MLDYDFKIVSIEEDWVVFEYKDRDWGVQFDENLIMKTLPIVGIYPDDPQKEPRLCSVEEYIDRYGQKEVLSEYISYLIE